MNQNNDDIKSPVFDKKVAKAVMLDMLSDQELIDELIERRRLLVVTAHRSYPIDMHNRPGLMQAVNSKLASDVGEYLSAHQLLATDETFSYHTRFMQYGATAIVLSVLPEENPI